ncbi:MAG TPA: PQQ-binding-like beta-propeller repeat protein [Gemmataceae bacterium]|nr:PQQ-binding-like beta-propeller repeat protein [Gemmataceae bacterium]
MAFLPRYMLWGASAAGILIAACCWAGASDWPHWRGPQRNDIVEENSGWKDGRWADEKPIWEAAVGEGSTSPLIAGGRLYVMGWEGGEDHVRCLEAKTGKPVWTVSYKCPQYGRHATGDESAYSGPTSTPEYDADTGYLYTLSCDADLKCWDAGAQGKKVWGINLYDRFHVGQRPASKLEKDDLRDYGYTTAPYVHGDWVIVEVGAKDGSLIAFDKRTGERRWASEYRGPAGHTGGLAPITVERVPCVAVLSLHDLLVVRLDRGNEGKTVAKYPWRSAWADNVLTPAVQGDCVVISSWHTHKSICKVKITLRGAERLCEQPYASHVGSPVVHLDYVYMASERLLCLDWKTGRLVWEGGSYGNGGACIVTGDDKLIVWSDRGRVTLVESARESPKQYRKLAQIAHVFIGGHAWPHTELADGLLYCKDRAGKLKCFSTSGTARGNAAPRPTRQQAQGRPLCSAASS